jgi:hypothetical protein
MWACCGRAFPSLSLHRTVRQVRFLHAAARAPMVSTRRPLCASPSRYHPTRRLQGLAVYIDHLERGSEAAGLPAGPPLGPLLISLLLPCLAPGVAAGMAANLLPSRPTALGLSGGVLCSSAGLCVLWLLAAGRQALGMTLLLAGAGAAASALVWRELGGGASAGARLGAADGCWDAKKKDDLADAELAVTVPVNGHHAHHPAGPNSRERGNAAAQQHSPVLHRSHATAAAAPAGAAANGGGTHVLLHAAAYPGLAQLSARGPAWHGSVAGGYGPGEVSSPTSHARGWAMAVVTEPRSRGGSITSLPAAALRGSHGGGGGGGSSQASGAHQGLLSAEQGLAAVACGGAALAAAARGAALGAALLVAGDDGGSHLMVPMALQGGSVRGDKGLPGHHWP